MKTRYTLPRRIDLLKIFTRIDVTGEDIFLRSQVGIGSSKHCLFGGA